MSMYGEWIARRFPLDSDTEAGSRLIQRAWRWHQFHSVWLPSAVVALVRLVQLRRCRRGVICRLDTGHRFLARPDDVIQCTICINGEWEGLIYRSVREFVPPGGIVLDVGAHVGYSSIRFADWVGPQGHVHAFEPLPWHRRHIQENLRLNGMEERVEIHDVAVADREGQASFHYSNVFNTGMGSLFERRRSSRTVNVVTTSLDSWRDRKKLADVDLVKIDVEGAELAVLEGMEDGLGKCRYRALLIEVHEETLRRLGRSSKDIVGLLERHGYELSTWSSEHRFEPLVTDGPISYLLAIHGKVTVAGGEGGISRNFV